MVSIEIDGKKYEVKQGQMIIEVADEAGIPIPRFCYHKKLSIAANCRMCLVEVANVPKPLPACATPVSEGMKIFTLSERARDAQKAVMEFLLINHPLDCPVCDQGGQCELQDVALMYGKSHSRYAEEKRAVKDKNLGPLISTEMTRCIHCTRCVRFGAEVAGAKELGATGRGEHMEIGTYIEESVNSEVSGNVIDLCPVGALTSKPFRFSARAWEMIGRPSVSAHDCLGSNLLLHTLRDKVMRALPRENENINEVWLSDRDRFSYEGLQEDRLTQPWIKQDNEWKAVDWQTALNYAIEKLQMVKERAGPDQIGAVASPNCTLEEFYLLQKMLRLQNCHHIDHRLRQVDVRHHDYLGCAPQLGIALSELEMQERIVIIGSNVRKELPILAMRLRKAALQGAQIFTLNPYEADLNFTVTQSLVGEFGDLVQPIKQIIKALLQLGVNETLPHGTEARLSSVQPSSQAQGIAQALKEKKVSVIVGAYAWSHPQASEIYWWSRLLAKLSQATWGETSNGANSAGAWLAGCVPHRLPMGQVAHTTGLSATEMWQKPRQAYLLMNCEPDYDTATPYLARQALQQAQTVIALTPFDSLLLRETADVLLPTTPISEMAGTYVNALGNWQNIYAAVPPMGESRPGWKVLRVLANIWETPGFDYENIDRVLAEIQTLKQMHSLYGDNLLAMSCPPSTERNKGIVRIAPTPLYAVDSIVRRAESLQQTADARYTVKMNATTAQSLQLANGNRVWIMQDGQKSEQPLWVEIDERMAAGTALVAAGIEATRTLGAPFGTIELSKE